jgi:hypothetical protein
MYVGNIALVTVIVVVLFALPIFATAISQKIPKPFIILHHFTKVFNKAFIIQLIIGVVLVVATIIVDRTLYRNGYSNVFLDTFAGTAYVYTVVGLFMYLPALGLLNLINWIVKIFSS